MQPSSSVVTDFDLAPAYNDLKQIEPNTAKVIDSALVGTQKIISYPAKHWLNNVGFKITSINVGSAGDGYTNAPVVNITGGGGSGATAVSYINNGKVTSIEMTDSKLTNAQWKRCVVYMAMWKYIYPQLTKWNEIGNLDSFQIQIEFYKDRYSEEFQQVLRDGVEYDEDGGGTIAASEKEAIHTLRLTR